MNSKPINPERLAYWYLRLNGYFSIVNFVIHPESRGSQLTDADILAVRFPFSVELENNPMPDDPIITNSIYPDSEKRQICFLIGEVKTGLCNINGPWINPDRKNMQRVLRRMGFIEEDPTVEIVARELYQQNLWQDDYYVVRQITFGAYNNPQLPQNVIQVVWDDIASFMFDRFRKYEEQKAQHDQWEIFMKKIFKKAIHNKTTKDDFVEWIKREVVGLSLFRCN